MAFSEIRGRNSEDGTQKSEVGSQGSEDRFQRSEIRSKELYNPHFFHQHPTSVILHLFSALCPLLSGHWFPHSAFSIPHSILCHLSAVISCTHQSLSVFRGLHHIPASPLYRHVRQPDHTPLFPGRRWPGYCGPAQNPH